MNNFDCDVLVIGGGVSGVAAAIAAARNGSKTVLLESKPFIGGNGATGYCLHNFFTRHGKQVVFGMAQEIVDKLREIGGSVGHVRYGGFVHTVTPVDGELFKATVTKMLVDAGATVYYGVNFVGVEMDGDHIKSVQAAFKGGLVTIRAKTYIDASGDGDLSVAAGAPYEKGDPAVGGKMQPVTMHLRFYGTDNKALVEAMNPPNVAMGERPDYPGKIPVYFNGSFSKWNDVILADKVFPNKDHMVFFNTVWPNHINVNTTAVIGVDGTDPVAMSNATNKALLDLLKVSRFMKTHVPGFKDAYFSPSTFVGVRETRRIMGRYVISDDDVKEGRKFEDSIGCVCYPVDIHDPFTGQTYFIDIGNDGYFDIPYRALIPQGVQNLLVTGRCISGSVYAHGAVRNKAHCLTSGQSSGIAASMAAGKGIDVADLDYKDLRPKLLEAGMFLG